ncbi:hypothetical protein [Bradyrhizobium roseum]|uniref:hypothetical protein n=1 Tax=Bradyrhizobium roseum TaxID=3056648 RepID=UPI0026211322|nr:hypothetical protein [Bradyrhizobium roseus]WKA31611.1 hypothetical protein QUH67_16255 [Bradyrhizobium roseus]
MAESNSPFVWGAAGEQLTPGQIAARRKVAEAMIAQGGDYSPIRSAWQGAARIAQGLLGGLDAREADKAEAANATAERQIIAAMLAGAGGGSASNAAPAASPAPPVASPMPPAASVPSGPDAPVTPVSRSAVLPSARVWGDKEAEDAGIYEKPASGVATVAAAMPKQSASVPAAAPAGPANPGVATVAAGMNPAIVQAVSSPYVSDRTRSLGMTMLAAAMKPKEKFTQETDAAGNVWNVNGLTGERKLELKSEKPEEASRPITAEERRAYGIPDGMAVAMTKNGPKAIGTGPGTTVNVGGGSDKQIFDAFDERAKLAKSAATGLVALRDARAALDSAGGAITGAGADTKLLLSKAGAAFGITDPKAAENTETFRAAIAPQVAAMLKSTVGTTNISNSDREFAEKAAGGSITLEAGSIKRLLNIMERAAVARLQEHQEQLDAVYPDPEKHKRERALFGVKVPDLAAPPPPAGATKTGVKWSVE